LFHDSIWIFGPQASRYYCPGIRNSSSLEPLITKRVVLYPQLQLHLHPSIDRIVRCGGGGWWWCFWLLVVESNSPDFLCSKRNEHLERRPQSEKWCCWLAAVVCICIYLHLQLQLQTATPAPFRFVQSALPLCRHKQPPPSIFVLCSPVLCSSPVLSCPVLSAVFFRLALPSCPRVIPQQNLQPSDLRRHRHN
jgi:hypothetical protein